MPDPETLTCPSCGATFSYEQMAPRDPEEDQNTQVDWLVAGRCPECRGAVSVPFDALQRIAARADEAGE